MNRRVICVALTLVLAAMLVGCVDTTGDWTAQFVRYETATGAERVAVVRTPQAGHDSDLRALTTITDLREGDLVTVRDQGKSWDVLQGTPEVVIVARLKRK